VAAKTIDEVKAPAFEFGPMEPAILAQARQRASDFTRKQNPSGYEESPEPPPESAFRRRALPARSTADNAATLYGSWWHTLFQHFPWTGGPEQWQTAFAAVQSSSPDPDRSAREWKFFTKELPVSVLAEYLARPGIVTHTELPFLWRMDDRSCVEGVIDLLLVDPTAGRALLVDWKTNRIKPADAADLQQRYRPQLAAYWKAVGEITRLEVTAGIFSTAAGQFMPYNAEDLAAEWERLRKLPPDELLGAVLL
jgi:ATP-dependent exoDNAse (exonuclease V) beta subunit